jgi:hypothetical protein
MRHGLWRIPTVLVSHGPKTRGATETLVSGGNPCDTMGCRSGPGCANMRCSEEIRINDRSSVLRKRNEIALVCLRVAAWSSQ